MWVLTGMPRTPGRTRQLVREWCSVWDLHETVVEHTVLAANELVTRAVRRAAPRVVVSLTLEAADVLVEVSDPLGRHRPPGAPTGSAAPPSRSTAACGSSTPWLARGASPPPVVRTARGRGCLASSEDRFEPYPHVRVGLILVSSSPRAGAEPARLQIGGVAERTGLSLRTIRHYEEVGLLPEAERSPGGFRLTARRPCSACWSSSR